MKWLTKKKSTTDLNVERIAQIVEQSKEPPIEEEKYVFVRRTWPSYLPPEVISTLNSFEKVIETEIEKHAKEWKNALEHIKANVPEVFHPHITLDNVKADSVYNQSAIFSKRPIKFYVLCWLPLLPPFKIEYKAEYKENFGRFSTLTCVKELRYAAGTYQQTKPIETDGQKLKPEEFFLPYYSFWNKFEKFSDALDELLRMFEYKIKEYEQYLNAK